MIASLSVQSLTTENFYILAIAALMPLMAGLIVLQTNPYQALVIRGILGAIAALVYTLFGAADVALTEALVGTFLSVTLYAIAVRSSLNLRLGVLDAGTALPIALSKILEPFHLRLEVISYEDPAALEAALARKEIHAIYSPANSLSANLSAPHPGASARLQTRVKRLYDLMSSQLSSDSLEVSYFSTNAHQPLANK